VCQQVADHARARFAPSAVGAIAVHPSFGVVGAVAPVVDMGAVSGKLCSHLGMEVLDGTLAVEALSNSCLVGNHKGLEIGIIDTAYGFDRAVDPVQIVHAVHIASIVVQHPVAVKKHRRSALEIHVTCGSVVIGHTDV
jgi:hypothetical protein